MVQKVVQLELAALLLLAGIDLLLMIVLQAIMVPPAVTDTAPTEPGL